MLNAIWNQIRGSVRIRMEGGRPEKILNLCAAENLSFWDAQWLDDEIFTCRMSRRDWKYLKRLLEAGQDRNLNLNLNLNPDLKLNLDLNLNSKDYPRMENPDGLPYWIARIRRRHALFISLVIGLTALFLGSFFIWDFQIIGNETVPAEKILRALEKQGVSIGTFGLALDGEDIRNHVLLDVPELQWIAVNVSGCRANVRVVERVNPPEIWDRKTPSNIIARRDGLILEVHALDGVPEVQPGMSVTSGQLLISGAENLETTGKTRMMAGDGSVKARTWYVFNASIPLNVTKKQPSGREEHTYSLILGKYKIKIWGNSSISGRECDKIIKYTRWTPFDISLPVIFVRENHIFYDKIPDVLSVQEAQKRGEWILKEYLRAQVAPYGEIRSALCTSKRRGDILDITLSAECIEEIGVSAPVL